MELEDDVEDEKIMNEDSNIDKLFEEIITSDDISKDAALKIVKLRYDMKELYSHMLNQRLREIDNLKFQLQMKKQVDEHIDKQISVSYDQMYEKLQTYIQQLIQQLTQNFKRK